jgi:trehalose-6-phosphate synthase
MTSLSALSPLAPLLREDIERLDTHLPTVNVLSLNGPGQSGGVPTSLEPVVQKLGTKVNWFAFSNLPDGDFDPKSDLSKKAFTYHRPNAPKLLEDDHRRIAQNYLSPLLHGFAEKARFEPEAWKSFRALGETAAAECLAVGCNSFPTLVWIHDYQLVLASKPLASNAGIVLCQFWHVPWPKAEQIERALIGRELTEALLYNRLVGFHTVQYAENFLATVRKIFPTALIDDKGMTVTMNGRTTQITVMPLGIDLPYWQNLARSARPIADALASSYGLASQIILGVDKLEFSKGILERLDGLEQFCLDYPAMRRRFHYVQISQVVPDGNSQLQDYTRAVEEKIASVNSTFGENGWKPIMHVKGNLAQRQLAAWYQAADVLSVNSIADGLNLIAKEYVASRLDEQGVLVLSKNAGAAQELAQGAILVDPSDKSALSTAFYNALIMGAEEKRKRNLSMRHVLSWNQLHNWALGFLNRAVKTR